MFDSGPVGPSASLPRSIARVVATVSSLIVLSALSLATAMLWVLYDIPLQTRTGNNKPSLLVEAANGQPIGRVGALADSVERQDFPNVLVKAVLSIEDRRFYSHWALDPQGIARAAYANWSAGGIVEGGSTITQQLAKLQIVGGERSLDRKIREAFTAVWLDFRLGKDEILTRYLNSVYLGAGAYGMSAAARLYFDKSLSDLALPEAAMLAGLIQAPSRYDPINNLQAAQHRAAVVLDAMVEAGAIDGAAADQAKATPAQLKLSQKAVLANTWFADWIARHEVPKVAGAMKRTMRVLTTFQPELQRLAERVVADALNRAGRNGISQAALVAMRPDGAVLAMVGGRDYNISQFNRAVEAQRQPGSAFKLFVYYAALEAGYSPDDIIDASPIEVGRWRPENYGGQHYGDMRLSQAFAHSVNTAAVRLAMKVGLDRVAAAARELGLDAPLAQVPSMALGTNEVTLLDLTGAFASVRAGQRVEPWGIAAFGAEGTALRALGNAVDSKRTLSHHQELTRLLREVVESGTGRAAAVDSTAMGKTGTSQDYRDAWFVGSNRSLVVGVWVGNDDRTPMKNVTGGTWPAQIWKDFVGAATPALDRIDAKGVAEAPDPTAVGPSRDRCDHSACAAAYNSFRSSDCTYQSYAGSRRRCMKGLSRDQRIGASTEFGFNAPSEDGDASALDQVIPTKRRAREAQGGAIVQSPEQPSATSQPQANQGGGFGPTVFQTFQGN
jgi:penicillin-binding protein 1A